MYIGSKVAVGAGTPAGAVAASRLHAAHAPTTRVLGEAITRLAHGTLPFTGINLALFLLAAISLIAAGVTLVRLGVSTVRPTDA